MREPMRPASPFVYLTQLGLSRRRSGAPIQVSFSLDDLSSPSSLSSAPPLRLFSRASSICSSIYISNFSRSSGIETKGRNGIENERERAEYITKIYCTTKRGLSV